MRDITKCGGDGCIVYDDVESSVLGLRQNARMWGNHSKLQLTRLQRQRPHVSNQHDILSFSL